MATPKLSSLQSPDAKTMTYIDESELDAPISNYTRTVEIWTGINGTGEKIATLPFSGTDTTVEYAITSDLYRSAKLLHVGSPSVAPAFLNETSQQFEQNLLNGKLKKDCGCGKMKGCNNTVLGFIFMYQSQVATRAGNSGLANDYISSAYKLLSA